jgi:hypothetical protein
MSGGHSRVWSGTAGSATRVIDWVLANDGTARYHDETAPPHIVIDADGDPIIVRPGDVVSLIGDEFKVTNGSTFTPVDA